MWSSTNAVVEGPEVAAASDRIPPSFVAEDASSPSSRDSKKKGKKARMNKKQQEGRDNAGGTAVAASGLNILRSEDSVEVSAVQDRYPPGWDGSTTAAAADLGSAPPDRKRAKPSRQKKGGAVEAAAAGAGLSRINEKQNMTQKNREKAAKSRLRQDQLLEISATQDRYPISSSESVGASKRGGNQRIRTRRKRETASAAGAGGAAARTAERTGILSQTPATNNSEEMDQIRGTSNSTNSSSHGRIKQRLGVTGSPVVIPAGLDAPLAPGAYAMAADDEEIVDEDGLTPEERDFVGPPPPPEDDEEERSEEGRRRREGVVWEENMTAPEQQLSHELSQDGNKANRRWFSGRRKALILVSLLAVIGVAIGVGIGLAPGGANNDNSESTKKQQQQDDDPRTDPIPSEHCTNTGAIIDPNNAIARSARYQDLKSALEQSLSMPVDFTQVCSPQDRAITYLANLDPLQLTSSSIQALIQRFTLLVFYYATNGPTNWFRTNNWLNGTSECQWEGITCENGPAVSKIELKENGLSGSLVEVMGELRSLEIFDVHENDLKGQVPKSLGNWTNLKNFDVDKNDLTGTIFDTVLRWSDLEHVQIWKTKFNDTTVPTEIGTLTELRAADIGDNYIGGTVPSEIGLLLYLTRFEADSNNMYGPIPKELGNLVQMTKMRLDMNNYNGTIPTTLGNLQALTELRMEHNSFTGPIPPHIGNLTALQFLFLDHNSFEGPIPSEIGNLKSLEQLFLSFNDLVGPVPDEVCDLRDLKLTSLVADSDCRL